MRLEGPRLSRSADAPQRSSACETRKTISSARQSSGWLTALAVLGCTALAACPTDTTLTVGDDTATDLATLPDTSVASDTPGAELPPPDTSPDQTTSPDTEPEVIDTTCVTDFRYFARDVWAQTLQAKCSGCHNGDGLASGSGMVFQPVNDVSDLETNHDLFKGFAAIPGSADTLPYILAKPTGSIPHGGGQVFEIDDEHFQRIQGFIQRLESPTESCSPEPGFLDGVTMESPYRTLRRFALNFATRLPTADEIAAVDAGGESALEDAIDALMDEPAFGAAIAEGFNDILLTEGAGFEVAMLGFVNHPNILWFNDLPDEERKVGLADTVYGVKQSVNALIANIVNSDEPFSNILLADYAMVNPASAKAFGLFDTIAWDDPDDRDEFRVAKLHFRDEEIPYPHAGVLNSYIYLNKYLSTDTNVNRARARAFLLHFLGTDIVDFSPVLADPLAIIAEYDNPIRDAPNCAVCHVAVDSIAGVFHNHYSRGARYSGPVPENTFPAGFRLSSPDAHLPIGERSWTGGLLPEDRDFDSLRWLSEQAVADDRFAPTMVKHVFSIVLGRPLLVSPSGDPSPTREAAFRAYEEQQLAIRTWADSFLASNYDLKALVRSIVMSPFYRARFQTAPSDEADLMRFDLGRAQLLKPLELDRKLRAIFGDTFQVYPLYGDGLLDKYRILYGGINSSTVDQRLYEPNGMMAGVQQLIANNVSCRQASREFDKPAEDRLLLQGVELDTTDEVAIRDTLVHLHERILGERVEPDSGPIDISYDLFTGVRDQGVQEIADKNVSADLKRACEAGGITEDPTYVVRAWAAVINYHMQSFDFLYN